jgi:hypothetical protein
MLIFKKHNRKKDYLNYLFNMLDKKISEIEIAISEFHLEEILDDIEKNLIEFQNEYGSFKKYLIHRYGIKEYKFKYFLYNNITDYLEFLRKYEFN